MSGQDFIVTGPLLVSNLLPHGKAGAPYMAQQLPGAHPLRCSQCGQLAQTLQGVNHCVELEGVLS